MMTRGAETKNQTAKRFVGRVTLVGVFFALLASSLVARAVHLQVFNTKFLNQQADTRHLRTEAITAHRGTITDRNGEPLAISTPGSNRVAIGAAARKARELGYRTLVLSTRIAGETRDVAAMHAAIAREIVASGQPVRRPACILSGGETTVTVRGPGLGGRNQEFVLAAAIALDGCEGITVFSAGTDGIDGPTDAAGAMADGLTPLRAAELDMDPRQHLRDNDSYRFFERINGLVKTGPTGTNVMDVRMMLVE
jgi:hydroxypyruvate reductase